MVFSRKIVKYSGPTWTYDTLDRKKKRSIDIIVQAIGGLLKEKPLKGDDYHGLVQDFLKKFGLWKVDISFL